MLNVCVNGWLHEKPEISGTWACFITALLECVIGNLGRTTILLHQPVRRRFIIILIILWKTTRHYHGNVKILYYTSYTRSASFSGPMRVLYYIILSSVAVITTSLPVALYPNGAFTRFPIMVCILFYQPLYQSRIIVIIIWYAE